MSGAATSGVDVFELGSEHEQVVFCNDRASGLRAIVAIHSTASWKSSAIWSSRWAK